MSWEHEKYGYDGLPHGFYPRWWGKIAQYLTALAALLLILLGAVTCENHAPAHVAPKDTIESEGSEL